MTTIDRSLIRVLREDINKALEAVGQKHGIKLEAGNASFTAATATIKLQAVTIDASTGAVEGHSATDLKAAQDLATYAFARGASADWAGKFFYSRGRRFQIIGLLPDRRENCILAGRVGLDGKVEKRFIFKPSEIRAYTLTAN